MLLPHPRGTLHAARLAPADASSAFPLFKREDDCKGPSCEKSLSTSVTNLAIILGIAIPVVVAALVLLFLHRRNVRRLRMEDAKESNMGLDFGLEDNPTKANNVSRNLALGDEKPMAAHKPGQLSMDMNLTSPYLLPPGAQQSHDSIHSLARTFHNEQDPYRTIKEYTTSETGSIRSFNHPKDPSAHGNASRRTSLVLGQNITGLPSSPKPRANPNKSNASPIVPADKSNPFANPTVPETSHSSQSMKRAPEPIRPVSPVVPEILSASTAAGSAVDRAAPRVQSPLATTVSSGSVHDTRPRNPFDAPDLSIGVAHTGDELLFTTTEQSSPASMVFDINAPRDPSKSQPGLNDQGQPRTTSLDYEEAENDQRGRGTQRRAPPAPLQQGLGVPPSSSKRLSVGFRPLPPEEVTESEDPEYRANRIRSFYKEYFEESREPPPPLPTKDSLARYYEDYDEGYLGEAAYYDADTNAFVMPYAQPVTRRAMTPPPAGRPRGGPRRPGPRGPGGPSSPHGSIGGRSLPGGGPRSRAGSAAGPRPGSSASARARGPPKKRLPPPAALNTLPTPSKLRDDSFAIDFAPPDSYIERAAGRSQSPLGERRPYQLKVPVASPLVTAFDELSALPSPHVLRKSSTFTNLDFAPPKKFKDSDSMSDSGSIRSNRSGISAVQLGAIRSGAGRVSRLPGDTVFTTAALNDQLKPQWGMRN
ncbi:hypothetical protein CDD82_3167 [Ophiocordyceps australis]|uniref:Uncharacterized protein n=1 Tax=Ophiocordyceps australis TaxID=1399860 RepID=A0A2C5ZB09_9HYPO|nr:hypothetical protein CDD82_3167 [Ophiocordyceps australis]